MTRNPIAILLGCLWAASAQAQTASPASLAWVAVHVSTEVPARVGADRVFVAKITMKNTGTSNWSGGLRLRSQEPPNNTSWGTSFIYLGQGRTCKPGEAITFTSNLKAPSVPGQHSFRWQLARSEQGELFGEITPPREIEVEARPPESAPEAPLQPASGKRIVTGDDLEYVGSFKLPKEVGGHGVGFTESGLAFRKDPKGNRTLFVQAGLHNYVLYEASIPELVRLQGTGEALNTASVKRLWGELKIEGKPETIRANAGFWWDETTQTLYWSYYHGYMTGVVPVLGTSRLVEGQPPQHAGPWWIPDTVPWYKCFWGGVTPLPREFAERYTGGRRLGLGFGGYYSICAAASRGPALGAIAEPDPQRKNVDLIELLAYPWQKEIGAPRDGDYFVANSSWGGVPPESPTRGSWTMDDAVRAGVFIDLPDKHAFLALARLGTGRIGYDYGAIVSAGHASWWYFYDPSDLGEAALGKRKPWEVFPHSRNRATYPQALTRKGEVRGDPGDVTSCCFDEEMRLIYLYQRFVIDDGSREYQPCIHAYYVKGNR